MGKFVCGRFVKWVLVVLLYLVKAALNLSWSLLTAHPLCDSLNSLPSQRGFRGWVGSVCLSSQPKELIHQQVQLCQWAHASSISSLPLPSSETAWRVEAGRGHTAADITEEEEAQSRSKARLKYQGSALDLFVLSRSGSAPALWSARVSHCVESVVLCFS